MVAGTGDTLSATSFEYDGTNWASTGDMVDATRHLACSGIQTAGLVAGGRAPGITNKTQTYDGSTFSAAPTLGTGRTAGAAGTSAPQTASLLFTGEDPAGANSTLTEEFTISLSATTAGAWASGGNMSSARNELGGAGTQTATVVLVDKHHHLLV